MGAVDCEGMGAVMERYEKIKIRLNLIFEADEKFMAPSHAFKINFRVVNSRVEQMSEVYSPEYF
jgi:hypothetical protein